MEEFLGVLFAGGRGRRLQPITNFISKAFVPVYDRPVFMYPLAQLEQSRYVREIVILTNEDNDAGLSQTGYRTIRQDDSQVHDMLSGLLYLRRNFSLTGDCVLLPCDNISDFSVDRVVETFLSSQSEVSFGLTHVKDSFKLTEMGVYDPATGKVVYKPASPPSDLGVIAPYVVSGNFQWEAGSTDTQVFNGARTSHLQHEGYWFDIGDAKSLHQCSCSLPQILSGNLSA
jgi:glucose-1-phosphate thymidylyltransferase